MNEARKFFINFVRSFLFYIECKILCCTERCSTKYSCRHRASARYKRYSKRFLNNACIRISQVYSFLAWRGKCVWQWTIRLLFPLLTHGLTVDRVFSHVTFNACIISLILIDVSLQKDAKTVSVILLAILLNFPLHFVRRSIRRTWISELSKIRTIKFKFFIFQIQNREKKDRTER